MKRLSTAAFALAVLSLAVSGWALQRTYDTADSPKAPAATTTTVGKSSSTTSTTAPIVAVPSAVGRSALLVVPDLEALGLKAKIVKSPSVNIIKGRVISQDPSAGTKVPVGSEVELTVSSGPP